MGIQINGTTDTISAVDGSLDINQNATFGNNVTIGGTLTYSDVTNIDSVGLVTAKNGLRIHAGGIDLTSGISTFSDNIQIADKIIHKDDTNTALRFPSADTFAVETAGSERLRIASNGRVGINTTNPGTNLTVWANDGVTDTDVFQVRSKTGAFNIEVSDSNAANPEWAIRTYSNEPIVFKQATVERLRLDSSGRLLFGTDSSTRETSLVIRGNSNSYTTNPGVIDLFVGNTPSNLGSMGQICFGTQDKIGARIDGRADQDWTLNSARGTHIRFLTVANGSTTLTERLRIKNDGDITTQGTTKIRQHSVGIGTTTTTGVNAGLSTAYGEMTYNTTTNNVQVYTSTGGWYNVSDLQGYYKSAAAASSDGMNHYWGGSSSTSIISGLTPSGSPDGSPNTPTLGHTSSSYYGDYPYFDFATGNSEVGYRFTKSGTKWGAGPFSICFWVDVRGVTMESESTYVQLGSHGGLRSLYTVSVDEDRKLKAITIGDDTGVSSDAQLIGNTWQHVAVTYNTSRVTKYYINGSLVRSHTHNSALDVGTSTQYIYLGYGYWNSSAGNKASISHMSDIGIWDAKELNATEILNIYNAKRIIRGY